MSTPTNSSLDLTEPIIWTSEGNVNESTVELRPGWEISDERIIFTETWFSKKTGEIVKRNVHIKQLKPLELSAVVNNS